MRRRPLKVALVALNASGYRSLALGYVRAFAEASAALRGRAAFETLELETGADPWVVAYRVAALEPDVVGFSVMCWNARAVLEACRVLARVLPEATLVLGGPEVGPVAEEVLAAHPAVDAVVRGEGEETFAELLLALVEDADPDEVRGVTARRGTDIASAPDRPLVGSLDSLPSPYLTGTLDPIDGATYLEGYRGCPHACGYCFEGKGYGRVRSFSPERVAAEVEAVASAPGVRSFSFIDPVFNLTRERLEWMADLMEPYVARGLRLHTVEVDVERVDADAAALLRRAGVASVETGPQTIGSAALVACGRRFDAERFSAGVSALRTEGIRVECDLIVGLPGDTPADVLAGLDFVIGRDPGRLQVSTLHVLPGTALWDHAAELGLEFDPEPPHEALATRECTFAELRRLELLGRWAQSEYAARV